MAEGPRPEPGKHRKVDAWGPREVIAMVVILGSFALALIALITDHEEATIPAWVAALVAAIGWYYYKVNGEGKP